MERNLLVLGGSSDIGIATIKAIWQDYNMIITHYNHMNDKLASLQNELGDKMVCLQANLLEESEVVRFINDIKRMDIVPTNLLHLVAMPIQMRKFEKLSWKEFQCQLELAVKAFVMILQGVLPGMCKTHFGRIVVMLTNAITSTPPKYNSDYVTAKYALLGLIKSLAMEYAEKGITVNGISPALIETKFVSQLHEYIITDNASKNPLGRNLNVEDVISTIKYLFDDTSQCVNGQNIAINGGV